MQSPIPPIGESGFFQYLIPIRLGRKAREGKDVGFKRSRSRPGMITPDNERNYRGENDNKSGIDGNRLIKANPLGADA